MKRKMPTVCLFKQVVVDLDLDGMGFLLSKWWPKPIKWRRPISRALVYVAINVIAAAPNSQYLCLLSKG